MIKFITHQHSFPYSTPKYTEFTEAEQIAAHISRVIAAFEVTAARALPVVGSE